MHQAARFGERVVESPQGRGPPHGEGRLAGLSGLKWNAARISRSHIVQQEIRVGTKRDVAKRRDDGRLSAGRGFQLDVGLRGEALHVADVATDIVEYGFTSLARDRG